MALGRQDHGWLCIHGPPAIIPTGRRLSCGEYWEGLMAVIHIFAGVFSWSPGFHCIHPAGLGSLCDLPSAFGQPLWMGSKGNPQSMWELGWRSGPWSCLHWPFISSRSLVARDFYQPPAQKFSTGRWGVGGLQTSLTKPGPQKRAPITLFWVLLGRESSWLSFIQHPSTARGITNKPHAVTVPALRGARERSIQT